MNESKAMIVGCAGLELTGEERAFFGGERPWGFILFARNLRDGDQIRRLTAALREASGRPHAPVFIDQEGGRVQRLRPPLAPAYPPARALGDIYRRDREAGRRAAWLMSRLHAFDLLGYGIDADCLPVLDVPVAGAHDVIGSRAYGEDAHTVAVMGRAAMQGLIEGGVIPVVKHIPGHGRAGSDSHFELPVVDASIEDLRAQDFAPFRDLKDAPAAMTAHVVYPAIDADNPATTSARLIGEIIRGEMGFDGLLMSDDVSMKALSGDFGARTRAIFAAGCDLVLHCNGDMDEMRKVARETPALADEAARRAGRAAAVRGGAARDGEAVLRAEFAALFDQAA